MKKLIIFEIVFLPLFTFAQDQEYNISSHLVGGVKAPNAHHLGEAWLNFLVEVMKIWE